MIAISKSSSNNDIFHSNMPDIAIFDKYTQKEGISKVIRKKYQKTSIPLSRFLMNFLKI